jgi:hypothetical protein
VLTVDAYIVEFATKLFVVPPAIVINVANIELIDAVDAVRE